MTLSRTLAALLPALLVLPTPSLATPSTPSTPAACSTDRAFGRLEREADARLGVYAVDSGSGRVVSWRDDERFAFASTIKALASGAVLDKLTRSDLRRRVFFTQDQLVDYSPVTSLHVADGMTVRELIDAAITVSDNTAGNLLMQLVGGPSGLDRRLERLGDRVTSVDRTEPDLNPAVPGDRRDTTTPAALVGSLADYALGDALARRDRRLLERTMRRTTTGDALIRAGVPDDWRVADKTGSADYGTRNDLAVVRPPHRAPVVVAVMTTHDDPAAVTDDALVAAATRVVVRGLAERCR